MPRCDDRFMGKPYGYRFGICRSPTAQAGEMGMGAIARFDHQTGTMATWVRVRTAVYMSLTSSRSPAPRRRRNLLVIVNRLAENHSDLAILNASDIAAGPIALLTLPVRVPRHSRDVGVGACADYRAVCRVKIQAAVSRDATRPPELETLDIEEPRAGEILVRSLQRAFATPT